MVEEKKRRTRKKQLEAKKRNDMSRLNQLAMPSANHLLYSLSSFNNILEPKRVGNLVVLMQSAQDFADYRNREKNRRKSCSESLSFGSTKSVINDSNWLNELAQYTTDIIIHTMMSRYEDHQPTRKQHLLATDLMNNIYYYLDTVDICSFEKDALYNVCMRAVECVDCDWNMCELLDNDEVVYGNSPLQSFDVDLELAQMTSKMVEEDAMRLETAVGYMKAKANKRSNPRNKLTYNNKGDNIKLNCDSHSLADLQNQMFNDFGPTVIVGDYLVRLPAD